jgi:hypothetical protein
MGVSGLWDILKAQGAVKCKVGSQPGEYGAICKELEGKVVAVDLSPWLMQASSAAFIGHREAMLALRRLIIPRKLYDACYNRAVAYCSGALSLAVQTW